MKRVVGHTKEDVKMLPKWARDRIQRLEQEVEHQKTLALSASTPEKTNVTVVVDYAGSEERGLPKDSRVRFRMGRTQIEVGIPYGSDGSILNVRSLDGTLVVEPQVSNVIGVRVKLR
jgi:hypothetical protein